LIRSLAAAVLLLSAACDGGKPASWNPAVPPAAPPPRVRGVILISIDTLRADRLGLYGASRTASSNLDGLARRSVVFEAAHAQAAQTAPSHGSVLTSLQVGVHGLYNVHADDSVLPVLPEGARTLAEQLSSAGILTGAVVSDGNLTRNMGMNRGFTVWDERNEDVSQRVDAFLKWLGTVGDKPFFGFLHTYQCHAPYVPPADVGKEFTDPAYDGPLKAQYERYLKLSATAAFSLGVTDDYWGNMLQYTDEDVKYLSDLYDGEISYTDAQLRRVFEAVLTGPRRDDTAIVVFGDHGEEFRDHGKFQHDQIYEELVHVPLIIYAGAALEHQGWKGRFATPVPLIDLAPTIAELLGVTPDTDKWMGRSLVAALDPARRASAAATEQPMFSEYTREHGTQVYQAISWHGWKYIFHSQPNPAKTWEELYDLSADPHEKRNLFASQVAPAPENLQHLEEQLEQMHRRNAAMLEVVGRSATTPMSEEQANTLNALGYTGKSKSAGARSTLKDSYTVKEGDTLAQIAQRELGSAELAGDLARLNGLPADAALKAGQVLRLH
jgi:arylsulfatase A-like enzyme